jgi:hypothetical protein
MAGDRVDGEHDLFGGSAERRSMRMTRGAVRYRDGQMVIMNVLQRERVHLRRAGFCPYLVTLDRDDGSRVDAELWAQDEPGLVDYLNAAYLLFDDEPGAVHWDSAPATSGPLACR